MADPGGEPHWRSAVDVPLIVLATATVLSLIRSIDQPSFSLDVGGTEVTFVLADAALAGARRVLRAPAARPPRQPAAARSRRHRRRGRVLGLARPLVGSERRTRRRRPRSSCSSTACSRSASCSSCADRCSSGCCWECWSRSRGRGRLRPAGLRRRALRRAAPGTPPALVPRRARSRGPLHDGARRRARRPVQPAHRLGRLPLVAGSRRRDRRRPRRRAGQPARALPRGRGDHRGRRRAGRGHAARRRVTVGRRRSRSRSAS